MEYLSEELVGSVNKLDFQSTIKEKQELSRARMGVRWVDRVHRELQNYKGDTLTIENREFNLLMYWLSD